MIKNKLKTAIYFILIGALTPFLTMFHQEIFNNLSPVLGLIIMIISFSLLIIGIFKANKEFEKDRTKKIAKIITIFGITITSLPIIAYFYFLLVFSVTSLGKMFPNQQRYNVEIIISSIIFILLIVVLIYLSLGS